MLGKSPISAVGTHQKEPKCGKVNGVEKGYCRAFVSINPITKDDVILEFFFYLQQGQSNEFAVFTSRTAPKKSTTVGWYYSATVIDSDYPCMLMIN